MSAASTGKTCSKRSGDGSGDTGDGLLAKKAVRAASREG
jgi:hypothetical protein